MPASRCQDKFHFEPARDAFDDCRIIRFDQRDKIRALGLDDFSERISPPFATVEDVVADQSHAGAMVGWGRDSVILNQDGLNRQSAKTPRNSSGTSISNDLNFLTTWRFGG